MDLNKVTFISFARHWTHMGSGQRMLHLSTASPSQSYESFSYPFGSCSLPSVPSDTHNLQTMPNDYSQSEDAILSVQSLYPPDWI